MCTLRGCTVTVVYQFYLFQSPLLLSIELLYGGFWEQEHQSANGGGWGNGHGLKSPEQHMFALTYVLQTTRDGFANLTKCVNALQTQWPKDGGDEDGVFQHFYFEVSG